MVLCIGECTVHLHIFEDFPSEIEGFERIFGVTYHGYGKIDLSFTLRMHHPFYFLREMHGLARLHVCEAEILSLCLHGYAERWRLVCFSDPDLDLGNRPRFERIFGATYHGYGKMT